MKGSQDNAKFIRRYVGIVLKKLFASRTTALIVNSRLGFCFFDKFSIAAAVDGEIVGVAIVGRPVSRYLDDGWTLEVNRLCTNGYRNACSFLYSAAWRAARNLGY